MTNKETEFKLQTEAAPYFVANTFSNYPLMINRKELPLPNGLIFGAPGSGKSFAVKREIINTFLSTEDDIIICDPYAECFPVINYLGGQVVRLSSLEEFINPMDIISDYDDVEDSLTLKSDLILAICEFFLDSESELMPIHRTIMDTCVPVVYREYLADPHPDKMPIMEDLYNLLRKQVAPEAALLASALQVFATGALSFLNQRTNIEIANRVVCYDVSMLGKYTQLWMLILQDRVWRQLKTQRATKHTWFYCDEYHLLLDGKQSAAFCSKIWKRFRTVGGIMTAVVQSAKDILSNEEATQMLECSNFILILNQSEADRQMLADRFHISPYQLSCIANTRAGEGLLIYGDTIIPFNDYLTKDTEMYQIINGG